MSKIDDKDCMDSDHLYYKLARWYYENQDYDLALSTYKKLRLKHPDSYEAMDYYSHLLYMKKEKDALKALTFSMKKTFSNSDEIPEICCIYGNYYSLIKDHEEAVRWYEKAIELDDDYLQAYNLLSLEYMSLNKNWKANYLCDKVLDKDPNNYEAIYVLSLINNDLLQHANKLYEKLVSIRPNDSRGWISLSANNLKLGNHKKAYYIAKIAKSLGDRERLADELTKKVESVLKIQNYEQDDMDISDNEHFNE